MYCCSLIMICTILILATVAIAAVVDSSVPFNEAEISEEIEAAFKCYSNPALAVSVVRDGKILLSKGYGVVDMMQKTPATNTTLFSIASVSKSFAASLLVKLLHEKTNLTVDSRIRELLGDTFQMPDTFRTLETTFADLMAHRTGVPPHNYIRFDGNFTRDTLIGRLHLLPSPQQFRVKYYYSNIMYGLVTRLAEIIGGQRWEQLISGHLFQPLQMDSSTFATVVDFDRSDVAVGYVKKNETYSKVHPEFSKRWANLAGSGSVLTNAVDMAKWMNFHLNNGQNMRGQQVMLAEHIAEVHKPRFLVTPGSDKNIRVPEFPVTSSGGMYALGFTRGFYRGYEHLSHSGSTMGYRAYISLLPAQRIGVFMALTGEDNNFVYRIPQVMYLLDRALGLESWLNVTTICSYPEPWKIKPKPSSPPVLDANATFKHAIQQYEGTYYNTAYGFLQLNYNITDMTLILTYGWGKWQLLHLSSANESSSEKFYGKPMDFTALYIHTLYTVTKVLDGAEIIVGIKVTAFEPEVPPIFEKININTNSVSQVMKQPVITTVLFISLALSVLFIFMKF